MTTPHNTTNTPQMTNTHDDHHTTPDHATTTAAKSNAEDGHTHGTSEAGAAGGLRFDNLSGFQRDILRALYSLRAHTTESAVSVSVIRERLQEYPHYGDGEPASNRFYPTANRLQDRGWLISTTDLQDARCKHYHLTPPSQTILHRVTASCPDHHHPPTTTQPSPNPTTQRGTQSMEDEQ